MKNIVMPLLAVIAAIILTFVSIPIYRVSVFADIKEESVEIYVALKDPAGNVIEYDEKNEARVSIECKDAKGEVSSLTCIYDNNKKEYKVTAIIQTSATDNLEYQVKAEYSNHVKTMDFISGKNEYEMKFDKEKVQLSEALTDNVKIITYSDNKEELLKLKGYDGEIEYSISPEKNSCKAKIEGKVFSYTSIGEATIILKPKDVFYDSTSYKVKVINEITAVNIYDNCNVTTENNMTVYTFKGSSKFWDNKTESVDLDDLVTAAYNEKIDFTLSNKNKIYSYNEESHVLSWNNAGADINVTASTESGSSLVFKIRVSKKKIKLQVGYADSNDNKETLENNGELSLNYLDFYNNRETALLTFNYIDDNSDKITSNNVKIGYEGESVRFNTDGKLIIYKTGTTKVTFKVEDDNYTADTITYNFKVEKIPVTAKLIIGGKDYADNSDAYKIEEQEISVEDSIKKPFTIDYEGTVEGIEAPVPVYECEELTINSVTGEITNADNIERNKTYTVKVSWNDDIYSLEPVYFSFFVEGKNGNDISIKYTVTKDGDESPFIEGRDGNLWLKKDITQVYVYSDEYTFGELYSTSIHNSVIDKLDNCRGDKEHLYTSYDKQGKRKKQRIYFGVDLQAPVISKVTFSDNFKDNSKENSENKFASANGDWMAEVECSDNFYDGVELYSDNVRVNQAVATEEGTKGNEHKVKLSVPKDAVTTSKNLEIRVYEKSGRYAAYSVGDFVQDDGTHTAIGDVTVNTVGVNTYNKDGVLYTDKHVNISCTVNNNCSGIQSVVTKINGTEINNDSCSVKYDFAGENPSRKNEFTVSCDTSGYIEKGSCKIEITVTDNAGNIKTVEKNIYIDTKAPEATSVTISAANNKGAVNEAGNFYSDKVTVSIGVSDEGSGVEKARLLIGKDFSCDGQISEGIATFVIPVGVDGNARVELTDKVGNKTGGIVINEINKAGTRYKSSRIVTEQNASVIDIAPSRETDNGNWYNSALSCNVAVTETGISSGIRSVDISVNGRKIAGESDIAGIVNQKSYTVAFSDSLIQEVINQSGAYTIKVGTTDNAGNEASYEKTVNIDTTAPVISEITGAQDGASYSSDADISFTVTESPYNQSGNHTTISVERTLDGETATNDITYDTDDNSSDKTYRFTEDGTYNVSVSATDNAGNKGNTRTISFTIDKTAPVVNVTGVTNDAYYANLAIITLNVIESNYNDNTVNIEAVRENSGISTDVVLEAFAGREKSSSRDYVFTEDGTYTVTINAADKAGNTAAAQTYTFIVDKTMPEVTITGIDARAKSIVPVVSITDEYFDMYSVKLYKRGITLNGRTAATPTGPVDVTSRYAQTISASDNGATVSIEEFEKTQDNDGVYTLVVDATDKAGNTHPESYTFVVNRFGSVYTFNRALDDYIKTAYVKKVDKDIVITEYNSDVLARDSAAVRITRDGAPLASVDYTAPDITEAEALNADSEWNSYNYTIKSSNFALDGVYEIIVTSTDGENNVSENINYDEMMIKFSVDSTAPTLVSVTGLDKPTVNSNRQTVTYNVFDAIGIAKVIVYNGNEVISEIDEFDDNINYTGTFELKEGTYKNIGFYMEDLAGNVTDSRKSESAGNVAEFKSDVTVSTNFFVRFYNNKAVFYPVAGGGTAIIAGGGGAVAFLLRRRRLLSEAAKAAAKVIK